MQLMSNSSTNMVDKVRDLLSRIFKNRIVKHLVLIAIFLLVMLGLVLLWLNIYTNHGQKLQMPDYVDMHINNAKEDAEDRSFEIIVNDSIHIVGQPGGIIKSQNPIAKSMVKENRKVYVTTTKYNADQITLGTLPTLYGNDFERKQKELAYQSIYSKIKERKYDSGEPDHILEVWYKGKQIVNNVGRKNDVVINKGDTLEFVLSKNSGAEILIRDLRCKTLAEARFFLEENGLKLGSIGGAIIENENMAYITEQSPEANGLSTMTMGEYINVTIAEKKPSFCN